MAEEQGNTVPLLQVHQTVTNLLQLLGSLLELAIDAVGLAVVTEDAAPIGLLTVVQRAPMPVFHHVGTAREEGVHALAQLSVVGWPLVLTRPARALGVGLGDEEVVAAADSTHEVTRVTDPLSVLSVLHCIIDIDGRVLHLSERLHLVDVVETGHEAVHDKLVGALILAHDVRLPV